MSSAKQINGDNSKDSECDSNQDQGKDGFSNYDNISMQEKVLSMDDFPAVSKAEEIIGNTSEEEKDGRILPCFPSGPPRSIQDMGSKEKIFRTVCANAAFLAVTLDLGLIGPALLDFELRTGGTTTELSAIFTCRAILVLIASLAFAPLIDRFNRYMMTSLALLFDVGFSLAAPWCRSVIPLIALLSPPELFNGLIGMATHVMCITLWREKSGPSLQSLNLMATIGYTLGPLIVKPFLAKRQRILVNATGDFNISLDFSYLYNSTTAVEEATIISESKIEYAYVILASYELIISILLFGIFMYDGCPWRLSEEEKEADAENNRSSRPRFIASICVLYFFFNIFYGGVEVGYAGLLSTFAVKHLGWSPEDGANVTALLQGSNAVITLLAVLLAKFIRPEVILAFNLITVTISMTLLSLLAHLHPSVLWATTAGLGIGYATIMPASYTWVNNFMPVTGAFSSAYWSGFFAGFMIIPTVTGYLFENVNPMWLAYMTGICGVAMIFFFTIINFVVYHEKNRAKLAKEVLGIVSKKNEVTKL